MSFADQLRADRQRRSSRRFFAWLGLGIAAAVCVSLLTWWLVAQFILGFRDYAAEWYHWETGTHLALDRLPAIAAALRCSIRSLIPE